MKILIPLLLFSSVAFGQGKKISQLPAATTPMAGTELLETVQGGVNKKITAQDIANLATGTTLINGSGTTFNVDHVDLGGTLNTTASIALNGNTVQFVDSTDSYVEIGKYIFTASFGNSLLENTDTEFHVGFHNNNNFRVNASGIQLQANDAGDDLLIETGDDLNINASDDVQLNGVTGATGQLVRVKAGGGWEFLTPQKDLINGSFSQVGTATTTFTVAIGTTLGGTAYKVSVTPTSALSAALFYVTNKTTTTFDVVYLAGLTGTITFDWLLQI